MNISEYIYLPQPLPQCNALYEGWFSNVATISLEVKHKSCSELEERMKIGTKMHIRMENQIAWELPEN